jgi:AbiV family abortive infection protein
VQQTLTEQQLLEGAWYALEQAGILMESAVSLYDARQWGTAQGVAMLGREELGRFEILRTLARETATRSVTVAEVRTKCADHEKKQAEGVRSHILRAHGESILGKAMRRRHAFGYTSPEALEAQNVIDAAMKAQARRLPQQRHSMRMESFYVDITDSGDWERPTQIGPEEAHDPVQDAVNDYSVLVGNLKVAGWAPDMEKSKAAMSDPPKLLPPRWPGWVPGSADL